MKQNEILLIYLSFLILTFWIRVTEILTFYFIFILHCSRSKFIEFIVIKLVLVLCR